MAKSIVIVGDSLSASYRISREKGWVSLLKQRLATHHPAYQIINLSSSGSTTRNGLSKLNRFLTKSQPTIVVIQLGSNDVFRGIPLSSVKTTLKKMIVISHARGARVLLISNRFPPNYGPLLARKYQKMYQELALQHRVLYVPKMLKGVAETPGLLQADGLHPTETAQPIILKTIWPTLKQLIDQ